MNQPGKRTGSNVIGILGHTFNAITEKPLSSFVSKHLLMLSQCYASRFIEAATQPYQQESDKDDHRTNPGSLG